MSIEVPSPSSLRRVLVTKLRHHGDVLLASPVISMLKRLAPQCEVDALAYADTAPMLEGHPALAQLHLIDRDWKLAGAWIAVGIAFAIGRVRQGGVISAVAVGHRQAALAVMCRG